MALAYLLDPVFEIQNSAGKPATNGWLEVYVHGSRERYYCASDFDGTLHPFKIPLDSLGSNIVLAEDDKSYDVYVYNRYGSLLMSRYNVVTGAGNLVRIVSGDGSIDVTWTDNGHVRTYDIRQAEDGEDLLEWFKSIGSTRIEETTIYLPGCTSGTMEMGEYGPRAGGPQYYHATAHVLAVKTDTEPYYDKVLVRFYARSSEGVLTLLESSSCIVDWSQGLAQEFDVSCDLNIASDCEICVSIEGQDVNAGGFELANFYLHRVYSGTPRIPSGVISRSEVESALEEKQDVIDDLSEIRAGAEAGATAVQPGDLATVATTGSYNDLSNKPDLSGFATKSEVESGLATKQDTLIAGDNITIEGNVISSTGGGGPSYTAGTGIVIESDEIFVDTDVVQEKLTAGDNITISGNTISASAAPQEQADWNQSDSAAVDYIKNKPNIPAAQVQSDWSESDSSKVDFIKNKPNLATVATSGSYNDLSNKPSIPAAQVQSDWNQSDSAAVDFIKNKPSIPAAQIQSDWSQSDSSKADFIKNKPTIPSVDQTYNASSTNAQSGTAVAGAIANVRQVPTTQSTDNGKVLGVTDANGTLGWVAQSGGGTQVQADWTETDTADPSYIQNKPTETTLVAGNNVTITESGSTLTLSASGGGTQVNADWDATSGVAEILHKPDLSVYVQSSSLAAVATSGDYDDLQNKPTIPAAQVKSDWNATSGVAEILNKPTETTLVAGNNVTITESGSTLTISASGGSSVTVDQTYDSTSANAQSGTAVAEAVNGKADKVSGATNGNFAGLDSNGNLTDSGSKSSDFATSAQGSKADSAIQSVKVNGSALTPDANKAVDITVPAAQVNSDWSASSGVAEILNKPDLVDIVAGPGIVVDNPDGNTLRVSVAQDIETVLWETTGTGTSTGTITVSEAVTHFKEYKVYGFETERGGSFVDYFAHNQIPFDNTSVLSKPTDNNGPYAISINMICAGNISQWRVTYFGLRAHWNSTFTTLTIDSNQGSYVDKNDNATFHSIAQVLNVTKIVGINRIAGGN